MTAMTDTAFDPTTLAPEPAPIPTDEPPTPDHTAADTPEIPLLVESPRDKVRRARERRGRDETPPAPAKRGGNVPAMSEAKLTKSLTQLYVTASLAVMPFDPTCAQVVAVNAEKCARSLAVAAQTNAALRRALIALTETSAWGGVMVAHLPILAVVAWHHSPSEGVRDAVAPLAAALAGIDTTAFTNGGATDD